MKIKDTAKKVSAKKDTAKIDTAKKDTEKKEGMSIEESLAELDMILEKLEKSDTSLEESFTLYEKGMKLVNHVTSSIDDVEAKIIKLDGEGNTEDEI